MSTDKLLALFDSDPDRAEERLKVLRLKLIIFFEGRGCWQGDDLADETFCRVLEKLQEGAQIHATKPESYFYSVAQNILLEFWRRRKKEEEAVNELRRESKYFSEGPARWDRQLCFKESLKQIAPEDIELLEEYYLEGERRRKVTLAAQRGKTANALTIEIYRIKQKLKGYMQNYLRPDDKTVK